MDKPVSIKNEINKTKPKAKSAARSAKTAGSKLTRQSVEASATTQMTQKAQEAKVVAARDIAEHASPKPQDSQHALKAIDAILKGASADDARAIRANLLSWNKLERGIPASPDDDLVDDWRNAVYPYKNRMLRKNYEKQKRTHHNKRNIRLLESPGPFYQELL